MTRNQGTDPDEGPVPTASPTIMSPNVVDDDQAMWFASLVGHLNRHSVLNGTVSNVLGYAAQFTVSGRRSSSTLAVFAAWARSMTNLTLIRIGGTSTYEDQVNTHLHFEGGLACGTRVRVGCIAQDAEGDLVAATVPVRDGALFPVDVLLRLVDTPDTSRLVAR